MIVCNHIIWPYTEHNICILPKRHDGYHQDDKGRKFGLTKYLPGEREGL